MQASRLKHNALHRRRDRRLSHRTSLASLRRRLARVPPATHQFEVLRYRNVCRHRSNDRQNTARIVALPPQTAARLLAAEPASCSTLRHIGTRSTWAPSRGFQRLVRMAQIRSFVLPSRAKTCLRQYLCQSILVEHRCRLQPHRVRRRGSLRATPRKRWHRREDPSTSPCPLIQVQWVLGPIPAPRYCRNPSSAINTPAPAVRPSRTRRAITAAPQAGTARS